LELADQGVAAAVAPGGSGGPEEPGGAPVAYRESQAAGLVGQGRGDEILPDPGRPGDDQVVMFPNPPAVGQQEKGGPVQTPWVPEVHVLDAGLLFEPGLFQPAGELSVFTEVGFPVYEHSQAFLEGKAGDLGMARLHLQVASSRSGVYRSPSRIMPRQER